MQYCILYYNSYIILYMSNGCVVMIAKNVFHCLLYQYNYIIPPLSKGDLEMCTIMSWSHFCTTLENFKGAIIMIECQCIIQWS